MKNPFNNFGIGWFVVLFFVGITMISVAAQLEPKRTNPLSRQVSVSWDEATLEEVFEWLSAQGEYNVIVQWRDLSLESIDRDTLITLDLRNVTVGTVLSEVLDSISDIDPITYYSYGNIIKVSTKSTFDSKMYTRAYDISDLLSRVKNFRGAPEIDLEQQQQQQQGGGGSGGQSQVQSIFGQGGGGGGNDDDDEDDNDNEEKEEELIEMIQHVVDPGSWQDNGGLGSMSIFNSQLVIRNTIDVHVALAGFFDRDS